jgi:cytochrome c-type biogenesis protein CcmH
VIFSALAVLMLFAAAAAVALPLWRGARPDTTPDAAAATHSLQLAELERDLVTGSLSQDDYRAARHDMEMEPTMPPAAHAVARAGRSRGLAAAAALAVLLASGVLYWKYGSWRVGVEGVEAASVPAVEQMVADLSARLHGPEGGDLQGWEMLGHAYVIMQRYPDATDAYRHAYALAGDGNPDVLAGYAEAMTLANPDDFMDKALPLFEKALRLDPRNPQALWYGGLGAFQRGDNALAVTRWQALLDQDPPGEYRKVISKYIAEAGGTPRSKSAVQTSTGAVIRVHLSLAPAMQARVRPDATLFLFAESTESQGGPPLAARKLRAGDLPMDVSLSDADAIAGGRSLADYPRLRVVARISVTGTPLPQAGDLMGQGDWKQGAGDSTLAIVIDTPVK